MSGEEIPSTSTTLSPIPKFNAYERTPRARALRTPLYRGVPHFKGTLDFVYSFSRIPLPRTTRYLSECFGVRSSGE